MDIEQSYSCAFSTCSVIYCNLSV